MQAEVRETTEQNLAQTLKRHRLSAGLTQEDLAERSGISGRTISDVERGLRSKVYPATARRLASALDLGEEESRLFVASVASPSQAPKVAPAHRLPIPPTPLVGRSRELQVVREAIVGHAYSLITLTGPGGVGKTRLALEAAHLAASHFPEGVYFISLGELTRPSLVPIAMARALGVVDAGEDPETLIADRLQGRSLILLDTFEHVLGAASLVHSLLLRCPGVTFLVTSRTALRLRVEQELQIPPLGLPPAEEGARKPSVETWPATSLFLQRALAVKPDLSIDDQSSRLIGAICRRLEGLPLAIELAASRLRHVPLEVLHDQLEHRLQLLVRGATDFPPRQRTMRNTLAWSHDLLTPEEQILYRRLSVFAGGWDLEAINPVCQSAEETLEVLSSLVDKSLIYLTGNGRGARYDMLDVVREYGAERLSTAGETRTFSERHAEHYLSLAEHAETRLVTADQKRWMLRLEQDHNNLRKALGWLIEGGDTERALRFVVALWRYWRHSGQLIEGRRWCESAIALPGEPPSSLRAKAYWATAALAFPQGDYRRMSELASGGLAFALESGNSMDLRNAHTMVGLVAMVEGRYRDALEPLHLALSFCRRLGQSWQLATSYLNLGLAQLHSGDMKNAEITLSDGLRIYIELGDQTFAARIRVALSHLSLVNGGVAEAEALARAALSAFASTKERQGLAEALVTMAAIRAASGESQIAGELHGAATALRETIAARPAPFDDEIPNRFLSQAREETASIWAAAWSRGRSLTLEAAVKKALGRQATVSPDPLEGRS